MNEPYPELSKLQKAVKEHPNWSAGKIVDHVYGKGKLGFFEKGAKKVTVNNLKNIMR